MCYLHEFFQSGKLMYLRQFTIDGRLLVFMEYIQPEMEIDLSGLPPGLYILAVKGDEVVQKKIIKE